MDDSFDEVEDNIRPPDKIIREQLIQDTRNEFEKEIDEALYASIKEYNKQQQLHDNFEEQLMNDHLNTYIKRKGEIS